MRSKRRATERNTEDIHVEQMKDYRDYRVNLTDTTEGTTHVHVTIATFCLVKPARRFPNAITVNRWHSCSRALTQSDSHV